MTIFFFASSSFACTGLQLKTQNNTFVNGRTVEFGQPLQLAGLIVPRQQAFSGTLPNGQPGLQYQAKFAAVGANAFGEKAIIDGINEQGLAGGAFYFPGYADYATINDSNKNHALAPTEFVNWALTQFANVDELKQNVKKVAIAPVGQKVWGGVPPFHYVFYDKSGKSVVIEPVNGQLVVSDNPIGVFTNSPTFDWHLTNLSNYVNLSPLNVPQKSIDGFKLQQLGQGSGLRGLPGDFTPPSRFIRAAVFSSTAIPAADAKAAVYQAFHILNQFDIPLGAVRSEAKNHTDAEWTLATTVKDPQNLKYYFRTYEDQTIRVIALKAFDLSGKQLMSIDFKGVEPIVDVSQKAHPLPDDKSVTRPN